MPAALLAAGGMYVVGDEFPLLESDAVSDSNDARKIEMFLASSGLPYTFFRPQVRQSRDRYGAGG
jgi:hypothetical protein